MNECYTKKLFKSMIDRSNLAYTYFQEYKKIRSQEDEDNRELFNKYIFVIPFIKKAYLNESLRLLNIIFEGNEYGLKSLRCKIKACYSIKSIERFDIKFEDANRIIKGLKLIRDKTIAHYDASDLDSIFTEADLTYGDIDNLFSALLNYLKYLIKMSKIDDITLTGYKYSHNDGIQKLLNDLKR